MLGVGNPVLRTFAVLEERDLGDDSAFGLGQVIRSAGLGVPLRIVVAAIVLQDLCLTVDELDIEVPSPVDSTTPVGLQGFLPGIFEVLGQIKHLATHQQATCYTLYVHCTASCYEGKVI